MDFYQINLADAAEGNTDDGQNIILRSRYGYRGEGNVSTCSLYDTEHRWRLPSSVPEIEEEVREKNRVREKKRESEREG